MTPTSPAGNYGSNSGYALADPNKPQLERALSTFDVPQMLKFSYSYDFAHRARQALLGNMPRVLDAMIAAGRPTAFGSSTRAAR